MRIGVRLCRGGLQTMKTFNEYIEAMLLYKESIGYSRKSYEYDLMRFCNYIVTKQLGVSDLKEEIVLSLSLIHISEPTRLGMISYAVFCLKKKKTKTQKKYKK